MRGMDALRKLLLTVGAVSGALALLAVPAAADQAAVGDTPPVLAVEGGDDAEQPAEGEAEGEQGESERIPLAESPRDRIGLILLAALLLGGGLAVVNARRQLRGERPQASGEFRWR